MKSIELEAEESMQGTEQFLTFIMADEEYGVDILSVEIRWGCNPYPSPGPCSWRDHQAPLS